MWPSGSATPSLPYCTQPSSPHCRGPRPRCPPATNSSIFLTDTPKQIKNKVTLKLSNSVLPTPTILARVFYFYLVLSNNSECLTRLAQYRPAWPSLVVWKRSLDNVKQGFIAKYSTFTLFVPHGSQIQSPEMEILLHLIDWYENGLQETRGENCNSCSSCHCDCHHLGEQARLLRGKRHGRGAQEIWRQPRCGRVLYVPDLLPGGRRAAGENPTGGGACCSTAVRDPIEPGLEQWTELTQHVLRPRVRVWCFLNPQSHYL